MNASEQEGQVDSQKQGITVTSDWNVTLVSENIIVFSLIIVGAIAFVILLYVIFKKRSQRPRNTCCSSCYNRNIKVKEEDDVTKETQAHAHIELKVHAADDGQAKCECSGTLRKTVVEKTTRKKLFYKRIDQAAGLASANSSALNSAIL
ncbi:uncharacterized protein LOC135842925 [Planococcus citri]|uniref:uncharacterized protein LOC135842925 n=1 Tax=Planococcus citri TaxID=170843 RepID=UPI0031F970AE